MIQKQQQRQDKNSITTYLDRKHGLSISAVTQTIHRILDSAAIYCNQRSGKDSCYIFGLLVLCENEYADIDSVADCAQMLEPYAVVTSETDNTFFVISTSSLVESREV